jgi:menaquinone-dependent protoporphyrinogen oxidase
LNILVASASKHGATHEIAQAITDELSKRGLEARWIDAKGARELTNFDAAVIGSAVYMGKWLPEAQQLVKQHSERLRAAQVWLFSSGPLGDPPVPKGGSIEPVTLIEATGARDHAVFSGKLDKDHLSLIERTAVRVVKAPYGDFRDWDAIRAWARTIGEGLLASSL